MKFTLVACNGCGSNFAGDSLSATTDGACVRIPTDPESNKRARTVAWISYSPVDPAKLYNEEKNKHTEIVWRVAMQSLKRSTAITHMFTRDCHPGDRTYGLMPTCRKPTNDVVTRLGTFHWSERENRFESIAAPINKTVRDSAARGNSIQSVSMVKQIGTKAELNKEVSGHSGKLIVIDFYAEWCGPCRAIAPKVASMAEEFKDVVFLKVNVDIGEPLIYAWTHSRYFRCSSVVPLGSITSEIREVQRDECDMKHHS
ncbi:hypothetical protein CRM22_005450 [Opisthorchis felineus]|uniref:Thioredoxin domain-containing protein n=1 Tax=Opisthorchis felineus TaxID=147828 RepID=A0A4S2LSF2_OPIFE|nr:hypothetical protein CRM22_005450 [Opisthorchis felineus]